MSKRIIFCADGTWNDPASNTNVYKLFKALTSTAEQCPIYDDGVGSDGHALTRLVVGLFGNGLDRKIREGYTRISHLYQPGDELFLFGFSRGAYTARSLAGMITACGLPTQNVDDNQTALAFQCYREHDLTKRKPMLDAMKQKYSIDSPQITMVGVWDTVGSLGIPAIFGRVDMLRYGFLDITLHPNVKNAYHAVSIDERRREFPATLWTGTPVQGQIIEQVYFSGVHCDIGGGYTETGLSDITLSWMMGKAKALGADFDPAVYQLYADLDAKHTLDQQHDSWSPRWGFPTARTVPDNATLSNSVQIRLQHNTAYVPGNLKYASGKLNATYSVVPVVTMVEAAAAAAGKS